jgi:hypothetical protein
MWLVNEVTRTIDSKMSVALYCAGLGDVIRVCYETASYRTISAATEPVPVIVASHNPFAMEIFRHHRNAKNFILYDLAHKYEEFLAAGLRGPDINRALCEFAGLDSFAAMQMGMSPCLMRRMMWPRRVTSYFSRLRAMRRIVRCRQR